jgi:starch-binding outer membrane protein, SusD/RagB family
MRLKYIFFATILSIAMLGCSEDILDTTPTDSVSGERVFETVENAYTAINGIYRAFYVYGDEWVTGYEPENSGIAAHQLGTELMGDDMLMDKAGSAWFWYDYKYWVRAEVNSTADRPYSWWNMFYKIINNTNYILAYVDDAAGNSLDRNNIKGQAFALRAYAYFNLIELYQRTYNGHQTDPGVPIYTEPTNNNTEGNPRGTVEEVYAQINADLDSAISRLQNAIPQKHISHIDLYVAHGLKARVALVQNNWEVARDNAILARSKAGLNLMTTTELTNGFSSKNTEWMWGSEVNEEHSLSWPSFWSHMDSNVDGSYASSARKCISSWLYNQISSNDIRKNWFNDNTGNDATGPNFRYNQKKYRVKTAGSWSNDLLLMRAAEMYLIEAEARCRLSQFTEARDVLTDLCGYKDSNFAVDLANYPDGNTLNITSAGNVLNLLDFIILQRRIELWGEGLRYSDIRRLKKGCQRDFAGSNHPDKTNTEADSWEFTFMIPQKEFDGNVNMDPATDQNP